MTQQPDPVSLPVQEKASGGCGGGCLKGCGIALLALLAVLVLTLVWAAIWGRPFLAARLPEWEAQQPLLTPLLDYSGMRARLVPQADVQELQQGRIEGENDRSLVPADIPLYEHALAEAYSVSASQVTGYQKVSASPDEARAWLLDGMGIQGWALVEERAAVGGGAVDEGVQLFWTKGERTCQMDILPSGGGAEIWLRSGGTP
ncbi:MAG: hypothetical protein ACYCYF_09120 [Anaerolineae bacterium]